MQLFVKGMSILASMLLGAVVAWAGSQNGVPREAPSKSASRVRMQEVTLDKMTAMIRRHFDNHRDGKVAAVQVTILDPAEAVMVPSGSLEGRVGASPLDAAYGRRAFDLALFVRGKHIETVKVIADVAALGDVVTATRVIKPDEIIASDDVTITRVKLSGAPHEIIVDPDEVIGKRAVKPIRPETPIVFSMVAQPYAVRRGDRVTIEAKRGGLVIQASGVTKAAAFVGQTLTVTNQDSGKDIRARVVGPGIVQVDF